MHLHRVQGLNFFFSAGLFFSGPFKLCFPTAPLPRLAVVEGAMT